jgi:hypothetical protein
VNSLLEPRFNISTLLPCKTNFPNSFKIPPIKEVPTVTEKECEKNGEIQKPAPLPERFELPSSQLLDAIHHTAQKNLSQHPNLFGSYQPDVLVALGILLQEVIFASKESNQMMTSFPNQFLEETAPNLFDILGPEIIDPEHRGSLIETLKNKKKRTRPEHLFTPGL